MIMHFGMIIRLFGSLSKCDTGTYETSHKHFTTHNYSRTSKRVSTLNHEMMKYSISQDITQHLANACGIAMKGAAYLKEVNCILFSVLHCIFSVLPYILFFI